MARKPSTNTTRLHARTTFLKTLEATCNVSEAAKAAGVDRATPYMWRAKDEAFAQAWDAAIEIAVDKLEYAARNRAVDGVEEPIIGRIERDRDGIITTTRRYSDTLLVTLLKAHRPEKYREKVDHEHRGSVHVEFVNNWRDEAND